MTLVKSRGLGINNSARGAAILIHQHFNEGDPDQFKRELVTNSIQAGADDILVTAIRPPDDGDGTTYGLKRAFVDNGYGMSRVKLPDYMGELLNGESILGEDGNFQMGARVSTLPINRDGVIVASWTEDDPDGSMIFMQWDPEDEQYVVVYEGDDEVTTPPVWVKHPIIEKAGHGTVFILMGNKPEDNTLGELRMEGEDAIYAETRSTEEDWHYFNSKWWSLPARLRFLWGPVSLSEWEVESGSYANPKEAVYDERDRQVSKAISHRGYRGVEDIIKGNERASGAADWGQERVISSKGYRATIHWAVFPEGKHSRDKAKGGGGPSDARDYGIPLGLFGERSGDEIYHVRSTFRPYQRSDAMRMLAWYGIDRPNLRGRVVIIVEPDRPGPKFIGARPNSSRSKLMIANADLPHDEWGEDFYNRISKREDHPIMVILRELDGVGDENEVKRQTDREKTLLTFFGDFWRRARDTDKTTKPGTTTDTYGNNPRTTRPDRDKPDKPDKPEGEPNKKKKRRKTNPLSGHKSGEGSRATDEGDERVTQVRHHPQRIKPKWLDHTQFVDSHPDDDGFVAVYNSTKRTLDIDQDHPLIRGVYESLVETRRADKHDDIWLFTMQTYTDVLVDGIKAVEFFEKAWNREKALGAPFVRYAQSSANLTALVLNSPVMSKLVAEKFKGRQGFGEKAA